MQAGYDRSERITSIRAFTLLELLAVIALILILLAVSIPYFTSSSAASRQATREMIKSHLQRARAHAIATGAPTGVLFLSRDSPSDLAAGAVTLAELEVSSGVYTLAREDAGDPGSEKKPLLQRWTALPGEMKFISGSLVSPGTTTVVDVSVLLDVPHGNGELPAHFVAFSSSGQISHPPGTIRIAFARAKISEGKIELTENNDGNPVFEMLRVNRLTGKATSIEP